VQCVRGKDDRSNQMQVQKKGVHFVGRSSGSNSSTAMPCVKKEQNVDHLVFLREPSAEIVAGFGSVFDSSRIMNA
jgi:hypothetical protein